MVYQVLGAEAEECEPEPPQPWEEALGPAPPAPDTWDVGPEGDELAADPQWQTREARIRLYDTLCQYFRPSTVPPNSDVTDLVTL